MNLNKEQVLQYLDQLNDQVELQSLRDVSSDFEAFNSILGALIEEKTHYIREDFDRSRLQLDKNFCRERLNRAIDIKLNLIVIGVKGFTESSHMENMIADNVSATRSHNVNNVEQKAILSNLPSTFVDELSSRDLHGLKISLLNLLLDHSQPISKLNELLFLMKDKCSDVFEEYREDMFNKPMNEDVNFWTSDYFLKQNVSLETNFSFKRYQHLLDVREYLRVNGDPDFQYIERTKEKTSSSQGKKDDETGKDQHNTESNSKSWIDELIDILVESLQKIKDVSCDLIEKVKSKLK
ncbi:hypothetical protein F975_00849 [Acinetobacter sp. ANC 3789]|uniref:hypothetical protein n=1 Tax=Acinetobacter sp. ANC 3789 TaxID=1217714 RepID=UPI0002CDF9B8|nr:hypothetical protein [Acinetobacter sp. ANC 3789]ENU80991.1 hypothetical protein F975_00849 [Acinetobacter sp. ANC 3789]